MADTEKKKSYVSWLKWSFDLLAAGSIVFSIIWSVLVDKNTYRWQKMVETQHMLEKRDYSHWKYILPVLDKVKDSATVCEYIIKDTAMLGHVREQLKIYEELSIGHNIGIYDGEVINRDIGFAFVNFHDKIMPYILYQRKAQNHNSLYTEYDECVKEIKKLRE